MGMLSMIDFRMLSMIDFPLEDLRLVRGNVVSDSQPPINGERRGKREGNRREAEEGKRRKREHKEIGVLRGNLLDREQVVLPET